MSILIEQSIVDIIKNQMVLPDAQVWILDQTRMIPDDTKLYVVIGMSDSQIISNNASPTNTYDTIGQNQQVVYKENIQIDIFSRSIEAIQRRFEILTSLASNYAVQKQETDNFSIFRVPTSFVNTSSAEGGSNLNRFTIIIACQGMYTKTSTIPGPYDYYDEFTTRVDDEKTIGTATGLIEIDFDSDDFIATDDGSVIVTDAGDPLIIDKNIVMPNYLTTDSGDMITTDDNKYIILG